MFFHNGSKFLFPILFYQQKQLIEPIQPFLWPSSKYLGSPCICCVLSPCCCSFFIFVLSSNVASFDMLPSFLWTMCPSNFPAKAGQQLHWTLLSSHWLSVLPELFLQKQLQQHETKTYLQIERRPLHTLSFSWCLLIWVTFFLNELYRGHKVQTRKYSDCSFWCIGKTQQHIATYQEFLFWWKCHNWIAAHPFFCEHEASFLPTRPLGICLGHPSLGTWFAQ